MTSWFWYAVVAAILYGAHQIFTRLAAERIGEGLGGFVVEATAALSILVYLLFLWLTSRWDQRSTGEGIFYSVLTGVCVGAGTIAFFLLFQKEVRSRPFRRFWLAVRRSWPLPEFCFSANRHHGRGSRELRSRLLDYFSASSIGSTCTITDDK